MERNRNDIIVVDDSDGNDNCHNRRSIFRLLPLYVLNPVEWKIYTLFLLLLLFLLNSAYERYLIRVCVRVRTFVRACIYVFGSMSVFLLAL